jgi:MoxR-like ATPase
MAALMILPRYDNPPQTLPAMASWPQTRHVFEPDHIVALRAAEAAGRPLLVRGDPGTGKSQLAHAAAVAARRLFLPFVVDTHTEATDLLWRFDAVARLADAHLASVPGSGVASGLDAAAYVHPGPLWWAFDWQGAADHARHARIKATVPERPPADFGWKPEHGTVLLIDEIDKAEAEVPNGLLEALGNGRFTVPLLGIVVEQPADQPAPLVIITTNDERELPAAFLRRCLVLTLKLPEGAALVAHLVGRGRLHFPDFAAAHPDVLEDAAAMLVEDRAQARHDGVYAPGLAEYLDLLRAMAGVGGDPAEHLALLRQFAYRKQPATG